MLGARTGAWSVKQLPYDAEVEYLESTGTQYINTGFVPTYTSTIRTKMQWIDGPHVFGIDTNPGYSIYVNGIVSSYGYPEFKAGGSTTGKARLAYKNSFFEYSLENSLLRCFITGMKSYTFSISCQARNQTLPICLFATYNTIQNDTRVRFMYFNASSAAASLDMLPVRFTNENGVSEGAMYDRVSGQLFRNQGTGAFLIGPDKTT